MPHPTVIDVQKALEVEGFYVEHVIADGKIHRFNRDSTDSKKCGWYVAYQNTSNKGEIFYVCIFSDWREPGNERKFISQFTQTKHDRKVIEEQLKEASRKREQEQERAWEEAAKDCQALWLSLPADAVSTEYLVRKGLQGLGDAGRRVSETVLYLSVKDIAGKLWGIQKINSDGSKYFHPGIKKKGNFYALGNMDSDVYYFVEGYATGLSVFEATGGKTVIVCFDAGNLTPVCESFRNKYREASFIIAGDNDRFNEGGNPGLDKANEAAKKTLGKVAVPQFKQESKGTDWNDLHQEQGIDEVKRQLGLVKVEKFYVKPLGYNEGTYFYTSSSNPQISRIYSHDSTDLLKLMPKEYWSTLYPTKTGVDWENAKSDLMRQARERGFFLERNVRGIGIWDDAGRIVINLGDKIFYDGRAVHTHEIESRNFYTLGESVSFLSEKKLTTEQCKPVLELVKAISVRTEQERLFLGGWAVVSVLSGVLDWRPHLWITGEPGAGKSTVIRDFISRLQCGLVRRVAKGSTEAGIRQLVKNDAVPVLYDEFETKSVSTQSRIEACLELICQASTDDSGQVIKGGSDGLSQVYTPRFCALVSSIRPARRTSEEESRFTFIELTKENNTPEQWECVKKLLTQLTDEYCQQFVARTISLYPVFKANLKTFKNELGKRYPQRISQQYAPLLAGWCLLTSESAVSAQAATEFVEAVTLDAPIQQADNDYDGCLEHLKMKIVKCNDGKERLISELIQNYYEQDVAKETLGLYGISVTTSKNGDKRLFLAKKSPELHKLFQGSSWVGGWFESLCRVPQSDRAVTVKILGHTTRGVTIPI